MAYKKDSLECSRKTNKTLFLVNFVNPKLDDWRKNAIRI